MISRSLENSVDTADSMKSRGYGLKNRASYSNYRLERRDILSLAYIVILSAYIIVGAAIHLFSFVYFPQMKSADITTYGISVFTAYLLLFIFPICIEIWEAIKWEKFKSKI